MLMGRQGGNLQMDALVNICAKTFRVQTKRLGNFGWIAAGECMGHHIVCKGRTKPGAVARWREQAVSVHVGVTVPPPPSNASTVAGSASWLRSLAYRAALRNARSTGDPA